ITTDSGVKFNLDVSRGPIDIFVDGPVILGRRFAGTVLGSSAEEVFLETHDRFRLKRSGRFSGTVAAFGSVVLGKNTSFLGAAFAETGLKVRRGSVLQHVPAHRFRGQPPAHE